MTTAGIAQQVVTAWAYYAALLLMMRLAGKRLAGQVTTFDLIVMIALAVVLQQVALQPGSANAIIFIVSVFTMHRLVALACARWKTVSRLIRGAPRSLIVEGRVSYVALEEEGLSYDDLIAGLRKVGKTTPEQVKLATLEETGEISVVAA